MKPKYDVTSPTRCELCLGANKYTVKIVVKVQVR